MRIGNIGSRSVGVYLELHSTMERPARRLLKSVRVREQDLQNGPIRKKTTRATESVVSLSSLVHTTQIDQFITMLAKMQHHQIRMKRGRSLAITPMSIRMMRKGKEQLPPIRMTMNRHL